MTEPATYLRVAAVLVPKEMKVEVEQKAGPLDSDTMRKMRRFVDLIPAGAGEDAVFEALDSSCARTLPSRLTPNRCEIRSASNDS